MSSRIRRAVQRVLDAIPPIEATRNQATPPPRPARLPAPPPPRVAHTELREVAPEDLVPPRNFMAVNTVVASPLRYTVCLSGAVWPEVLGVTVANETTLPAEQRLPAQHRQPTPPPTTKPSSPVASLLPSRWDEAAPARRRVVLEDERDG